MSNDRSRKRDPIKQREYRRTWNRKNRDKRNAIQRAYNAKNKDKINSRRRELYPLRYRQTYLAYKPRKQELFTARRKAALGRVCKDCGRSDSETYWSGKRDQCTACLKRERENGRCSSRPCGVILSRRRPKRTSYRKEDGSLGYMAVRGDLYCSACHDRDTIGMKAVGANSRRVLTVWDMLWTADDGRPYFTWRDVARVTEAKEDSARRFLDHLKKWLATLAIDARHEIVETTDGQMQSVLVYDMKKLRDILRPVVDALAGVSDTKASA